MEGGEEASRGYRDYRGWMSWRGKGDGRGRSRQMAEMFKKYGM